MTTDSAVRVAVAELYRELPAAPVDSMPELFVDAIRWAVQQLQIQPGRRLLDKLYGPHNRWIRAGIVAIVTEKKVATSSPVAGWHQFVKFCNSHVKPAGGCIAEREHDFDAKCWAELAK